MDIVFGAGVYIALPILTLAGIFNPIFVMAFSRGIEKDHFRSSLSKYMFYTLIGLAIFAQLAFATYVLIHYGLHALGAARDLMRFEMDTWNINGDTDYLQSYFQCCGRLGGPSDWNGIDSFRYHAKVRLFELINLTY